MHNRPRAVPRRERPGRPACPPRAGRCRRACVPLVPASSAGRRAGAPARTRTPPPAGGDRTGRRRGQRAPHPAPAAGTARRARRCARRRDGAPDRHPPRPPRSAPVMTPPGDTFAGPARRRRRSIGARLLGLLALAVLAVIVIGALMLFQPFGSAEGARVQVTIPQGSSARAIGDRLAEAGVVDSGLFFSLRAALSGKRERLRSGQLTLRRGHDVRQGDRRAQQGGGHHEGTDDQGHDPGGPIAARDRSDRRARRADGRLSRGLQALQGRAEPVSLRRAARHPLGSRASCFRQRTSCAPARPRATSSSASSPPFARTSPGVNLRRARRKNLSGYDVLIIASMVEREAQLEKERPLIAAVIYNRLQDGIPLGIDATSRYALNKPSGALTQSELAIDSPYNTRKRAGLPPTPIGNPGLSSIRAAAAPAEREVPLLRRQAGNVRRARVLRDRRAVPARLAALQRRARRKPAASRRRRADGLPAIATGSSGGRSATAARRR